ncbi:MAG: NAD(P)H-quinone oxidoreductase [Micrococcales bacterium]|nr:NAD(P)H-quinone oxidoreductase [Micrococcales bacterium]
MLAILNEAPGEPDVLQPTEVAEPVVTCGTVIVQVAAAGVNRADLLQRAGHYPPPPDAPPWPGLEVSGTVVEIGPPHPGSTVSWQVGDRVCALLTGGGYARRAVVDTGLLLPVPDGIDLVDAAALPEAAATVISNLDAAHAQPGHTVLVRGGSGGVGSAAVQIAAGLGLKVLATAGGPERVRRVGEFGADSVFDHTDDRLVDAVLSATDGRGVDIVLDVLGAAGLADNLAMLAVGGRLVVIGLQKGRRGTLDLGRLLERRASVMGTTLRSRPLAERTAIVAAVRQRVWPLVAAGRVRPVVHARLPLTEAAAAHRLLASGEVFGKVLLTC